MLCLDPQPSGAAALVGHLLWNKVWCQALAHIVISFNTTTLQNRCFSLHFLDEDSESLTREVTDSGWSFSMHQGHLRDLVKHGLLVFCLSF